MLVSRHKPKKIGEIIGNAAALEGIMNYIKTFKTGKAILLYGAPGIGKTIISQVISTNNKINITEVHASELEEIKKIKSSSMMMSLFGGKRIILVDEIDNYTDRGTVAEIISLIKTSKFPVILTANDAYDKGLRTLRTYCDLIPFRRIGTLSIAKKLKDVSAKEGVEVSEDAIKSIAESSGGDLRAAINDLQILITKRKKVTKSEIIGFRERGINVFEAIKVIFKSNEMKEALKAIDSCDKDLEEIFWWVEQNITNEYKKPEDIALAYDILSKADIFREKVFIGKNYRMLLYMKNTLASITLIRKDHSYTAYKPPDRMIILGKTKTERAEDNETQGALAQQLHCSKRCIKNQLPYLDVILK
ncbi:MAG: replication factor C large subunit [Candidatus Aenigmarchaeota archaeon]|nr:replication factor C large subunit [Candidatus Aenigmarchaeota archaeon]